MRIDVLANPACSPSILYGLCDMLAVPGSAWPVMIEGKKPKPAVDLRIVAATSEPFLCSGGAPVAPHSQIADSTDADIVCVTNMRIPLDGDPRGSLPEEVAWLRQRYEDGAVIASSCTGSLLLAEAGLLDGLEATSHWVYADMFRQFYPQITFRADRTLTFAGEGDRLVMSGGMASWLNLGLYLVARFLGPEQAAKTAKLFCVSETGSQWPLWTMIRRIQSDDGIVKNCQIWAGSNYANADAVTEMAEMSGLPRRSFNRRFLAATGYSPQAYIQSLRIEEAKQSLETSDAGVDAVAEEVGYTDNRAFRRLFKQKTGLSPSDYRRKFNNLRFLKQR